MSETNRVEESFLLNIVVSAQTLTTKDLKGMSRVKIGSAPADDLFFEWMQPSEIVCKLFPEGWFISALHINDGAYQQLITGETLTYRSEKKLVLRIDKKSNPHQYAVDMLKLDSALKIGSDSSNSIVLNCKIISRHHAAIGRDENGYFIKDNNSTNFTFLNGKRVDRSALAPFDRITVLPYTFLFDGRYLIIENSGSDVCVNLSPVALVESEAVLLRHSTGSKTDNMDSTPSDNLGIMTDSPADTAVVKSPPRFQRSPRIKEEMPSGEVVIYAPPQKMAKPEINWFSVFVYPFIMVIPMALFAVIAKGKPTYLLLSGFSAVGSVAIAIVNYFSQKKKFAKKNKLTRDKYDEYLNAKRDEIGQLAKKQAAVSAKENPPPAECANIVTNKMRSLWERSVNDSDFLDLRVGIGEMPLLADIKISSNAGGFDLEPDELQKAPDLLKQETKNVKNVPVKISLVAHPSVGFIGDRTVATQVVRNMLAELVTAHSYDEVKIVALISREEMQEWNHVRWYPHLWDDSKQTRFLGFDKESAFVLVEHFTQHMKMRKSLAAKQENGKSSIPLPYFIFIIGEKQYVEKRELLNYLTQNTQQLGAAALFLFNDLNSLPKECNLIVNCDKQGCCFYDKSDSQKKTFFTPDVFDLPMLRMMAGKIAPIILDKVDSGTELPNGITFFEGFGLREPVEFNVAQRWKASKPFDSLSAPIGVLPNGKPFCLDIHEKAHGPHGLVAGTTGSGKSELLQTWILSMSLHYHPHDVVFVIIDYKGGGMANLLEGLPHVVGKITNIGSNISRSLVSMQCEIKRRLKLFDDAGVNHIDKYQKAYKQGKVKIPLPHLIIVADEFAELKKDQPDFMQGLISTSRVGRSLGIHLVLATQKPSGVVDDQIWSNSRFKLCLKVQDAGDSREMIKRPDAAQLTQAGRCYIQVGMDEIFELFQSFWSGAPYHQNKQAAIKGSNQVRIVSMLGQRIQTAAEEKTVIKTDLDEITVIRRYIVTEAQKLGIQSLAGPWLPELPAQVILSEILNTGEVFNGREWVGGDKALSAPIGLYDNPYLQSQGVQSVDFAEFGHFGIYGAPGTGKSTLLKTLLTSLVYRYSPEDINLYIIDCGGWSMGAFSILPHVGGVVFDSEEEKFDKLQKLVMIEIEARKKLFLKNSVGSLTAYRQSIASDLPAIIIAVDNFASVFELYPDLENFFTIISREGSTYGVYLVFTANNTNGIRYKVSQNIRGAIAFELTDKGDYSALVGRLDGAQLPKIDGRAFFKGNPPLEIQVALPAIGATEMDRTLELKKIFESMRNSWRKPPAKPIPVMPESFSLADACERYAGHERIPLGLFMEDISTAYVDLTTEYIFLISGSVKSGKSTVMEYMMKLLCMKCEKVLIYLIDSKKGALKNTAVRLAAYTDTRNPDEIDSMMKSVIEMLNVRKTEMDSVLTKTENADERERYLETLPPIFIFIDSLFDFVNSATRQSVDSMERIARLAHALRVYIIAAENAGEITKLKETESLTQCIVEKQNGIALGGNMLLHSFVENKLKYTEKETEISMGSGMLFYKGSCRAIRLADVDR